MPGGFARCPRIAQQQGTGDVALKEVAGTYINETGELVHVVVHGEEIITTPSHPFYSPVKGWTSAVHLRAGDILVLVNGEYVVVEKIQHEILESPIKVYNFQVEGYHTYYVSGAGVLVHNRCRFNDDQDTVIQIAKENKKGLTRSEAEILVGWAEEYGIDSHPPLIHVGRGGYYSGIEHINIMKIHIPILNTR